VNQRGCIVFLQFIRVEADQFVIRQQPPFTVSVLRNTVILAVVSVVALVSPKDRIVITVPVIVLLQIDDAYIEHASDNQAMVSEVTDDSGREV
jgi:hypothetical protein